MKKKKGGSTMTQALKIRAIALAGICTAAAGALAQVPPLDPSTPRGTPSISDKSRALPGAHKGELGDKARPGAGAQGGAAPTDPAVMSRQPLPREPINRTGAIVIPRENCGTWWSSWGNDRDANPCPANCERGERLDVKQRKDGDKVQYQTNYRCYLPELVVNQPPAIARQLAAGGIKGQNCGTFWTTKQNDPNADVNPCPANCERGELNWVKRGVSGGKSHYEMNYRCYVAGSMAKAVSPPKTKPTDGVKEHPRDAFHPKVIVTESMRVTGTRRPPFVPKVITTDAMQLTGMRRPPFSPKIITAPSMELTGTRLRRLPINTDKPIEPAAGGAERVKPPGK